MKLLSVSAAVPSKRVTNDHLINEILEKSRDHISKLKLKLVETLLRQGFVKSGTEIRYVRDQGERAVDFTVKAGQEALEKAGLKPEDIDLLIFTGVGRGWLEPAQANLFQKLLGLKNATCFDVMDACASWIRSMSVAQSFIDQGTYKRVMILNSEFNNKEYTEYQILDPAVLKHSFAQYTLGEAATATILTEDNKKGSFYFSFQTWGEMHELCKVPLPNADEYLPNIFKGKKGKKAGFKPMVFFARSTELLTFAIDKLVTHFGQDDVLKKGHYDLIVGHDASSHSTKEILKKLKLDPDLSVQTHSDFGNTVSATIPLGLSKAIDEGRLKEGMDVLMICGSAGVSTAFGSFSY